MLKRGVNELADAVKTTLGPKGRNAVIYPGYGMPIVTKDGVTVAKHIEPEDIGERMGADLVRQAAMRTNDAVGDGTTTSTVLAQEIVRLSLEALEKDPTLDVHTLRNQMEERVNNICVQLDKEAIQIDGDVEKLTQVATISANNDTETGKLIGELMYAVGKNGIVTVDDSPEVGIKVERVEGLQFAKGYMSRYMITDGERLVAELGDPVVIVTDYRVTTAKELVALIQPAIDAGRKDIFMICEDLEGDALTIVTANGPMFKKNFNVVAVAPPGYGDRKKEMMLDICALTGASLISLEVGKKLEDVTAADYGTCAKVTVEQDKTTVIGGGGKKEDIETRIAMVKTMLEKPELSVYDKEKLQERLAKLTGGVAVIKIGAPTESEAKEKKYLIDDAVSAVKAAMQEGIVAGGGMALASSVGDGLSSSVGYYVIEKACKKPASTILDNAGVSTRRHWWNFFVPEKIVFPVGGGFDAKAGVVVPNMIAAGIVDPVSVTKSALRNALSAAVAILTTETLVVETPEKRAFSQE